MADKHIDEISGVETTGHEWDGIRELNNPMPRWWVYTFYATIVWAIGYTIAYPAWPLLTDSTKGLLGYSSRAEVAQEISAAKAGQAVYLDKIAAMPLAEIAADPQLSQFAIAGGAAAFKVNCSTCHGSGAAAAPAIRTSTMMTGCGAEIWRQSTRRLPTVFATTAIPIPGFPRCPPMAKFSSPNRSARWLPMS